MHEGPVPEAGEVEVVVFRGSLKEEGMEGRSRPLLVPIRECDPSRSSGTTRSIGIAARYSARMRSSHRDGNFGGNWGKPRNH